MNWYTRKIIDLIKTDECNFDCYCYFLTISVSQFKESGYESLDIELRCNNYSEEDITIKHTFNDFDFLTYIQESNYLKRNCSNKLITYSANLAELYYKYFEDRKIEFDKNGRLWIYMHPTLNGKKAIQNGFIEW